jgi:chorismate mutase / prephenate dehydratase
MTDASLKILRDQLKQTDREIVRFLNQRATLSKEIGKIKERRGLDVYDAAQESKIFEYLLKINDGVLPEQYLKSIFKEIISASRAMQKPLTVAFLGPEATFSHLAAQAYFGTSTCFMPQPTIFNVFDEVEKGKIQYGVVPVENSLEGSINLTLDQLISTPLTIRAELFLRIRHCLLSKADRLDEITRVYSIPQVLAQCQGWLRTHLPRCTLVEAESTAAAARIVQRESNGAAIGSSLAATTYDLNILSEGVEDHSSNTTRFLVIGSGQGKPTGKDKMSILFGTPHSPGALYRTLRPFARRQINMMKIESYPVKDRLWEYLFFVDFRGHMEDMEIIGCMEDLKKATTYLKVLGAYPEGEVLS